MKTIALILVLLLTQRPLFAQSCQQVQFATTAQQKEIIREYIAECTKKRLFFDGKGVVEVVIYQDSAGLTCWRLGALRDDRYRSAPPEHYAFFGSDVILVYKGDQNGYRLPIAGDKASRNDCLQNIVGNRVYERPTKKQFVYKRDISGKVRKFPTKGILYGNTNNGLIIIFNKDGTISKFVFA